MNNHYTYFIILAASIAAPFVLSFDKKVAFYTKWKFLFRSLLGPSILYIIWDVWFTSMGVWSFNSEFITGLHLFNLPVEEVLFFFIVPYCCVFIYECIVCYFPKLQSTKWSGYFFVATGLILIATAIFNYNKWYTSITFLLCGVACLFTQISSIKKYFNSLAFVVSYLIILVPFLMVNGILTAIPVVLYNDAENLGLRIYTIPMEDIFYGMLLLLLIIVPYERMKQIANA